MGIRDRVRRLRKRAGLDGPKPCPECGSRIIVIEHHDDGTVTHPHGPPCEVCESAGLDGPPTIRVIEVMEPGLREAE